VVLELADGLSLRLTVVCVEREIERERERERNERRKNDETDRNVMFCSKLQL